VLRLAGPIADAAAHLRAAAWSRARAGRAGGREGSGISVYFRDPDGSLLEFISYAGRSDNALTLEQTRWQ
jgi:catechol 2,3-dioxygenase-like lactoylglutathione lyase family enzyme